MSQIEEKLKSLNIKLPIPASPVASYVPFTQSQNLIFISGQLPFEDGKIKYIGKVGSDFSIEEAQEAAFLCGLNLLAQLKVSCNGDLDKMQKCLKLEIYINSSDNFYQQPKVANAVSDLLQNIFSDKGQHSRLAIGVNVLPFNAAVEVAGTFEI